MDIYGTYMDTYGTYKDKHGTYMDTYGTYKDKYVTHMDTYGPCLGALLLFNGCGDACTLLALLLHHFHAFFVLEAHFLCTRCAFVSVYTHIHTHTHTYAHTYTHT